MEKILFIISIFLCGFSHAEIQIVDIKAEADIIDGKLSLTIENKGQQAIILANPIQCETILEGIANDVPFRFTLPSKDKMDPFWKYLIFLSDNREDPITYSELKFVLPTGDLDLNKISKIYIYLWISNENDFKKESLGSFKYLKLPLILE